MNETEVFRITPEYGKFYEYAEYTRKEGRYPNEKYYTKVLPQYVGQLNKRSEGGYGDNGWRIDYFANEYGAQVAVNYSYEGRTSFREVLPRMRQELKESINNRKRNPSLLQLVKNQLSTNDRGILQYEEGFEQVKR